VVDRRLLTFLWIRQRKVSKRKRPHVAAPLGFPFVQVKKWENVETRFVSLHFTSLHSDTTLSNPFSALHKRQRLKRVKINNLDGSIDK
jgi:hypothetical protein